MHGGFCVGAILLPLFVQPFLGTFGDDTYYTTTAPLVSTVTLNHLTTEPLKDSRIEVPYSIVGVICMIGSFVAFLTFFKAPLGSLFHYRPTKVFREMAHPRMCGFGHSCYATVILTFLFLHLFQSVGMSRAYGNYVFTYALEGLSFSDSDASLVNMVYWIGFAVGRFGGAMAAHFIPTPFLMGSSLGGSAIIVTILQVFGHDEALVLWICTPIQAIFNGTMYPLGMAWGNLYLLMNSVAVIIPLAGCSAGGTSYSYLIGYLLDRNPCNWTIVLVIWCVISIVIFAFMQTIATVWHQKISAQRDQEALDSA